MLMQIGVHLDQATCKQVHVPFADRDAGVSFPRPALFYFMRPACPAYRAHAYPAMEACHAAVCQGAQVIASIFSVSAHLCLV
jgi:hypothetical protein